MIAGLYFTLSTQLKTRNDLNIYQNANKRCTIINKRVKMAKMFSFTPSNIVHLLQGFYNLCINTSLVMP